MPSETIKVIVRAKPLLTKSKSVPWTIEDNNIYERNAAFSEYFTFDKVFDVDQKNVDIFESIISPMVHSAIEGINLTIFAYGATSSGKTYTMNGTPNDPGVIPRTIEKIFDEIQMCNTRKFLVRVSYVEIYKEIINDLLDKNNKDLKIREDINNFINYNPTEKIIKSSTECLSIIKKGNCNRTTGETLMNASSSRSHSIFRIIIESTPTSGSEQDPVQVSQVNLIDLAGSERVSQTGATGDRFKEGAHINKSLTVLGLVIRQLVEKKDYISYRDSKLTRILSNSLGGNAETVVICNINLLSLEDTQSTLLFAQRAKAIKVKPKVTEIMNELSMTKKYAKECSELKILLDKELEKNKQLEQQCIMSKTKVSDLNSRIQSMQEVFVKKEPLKKPPKRRHTFCSIRKLSAISEEKESASTYRNSGFTEELYDMQNSVEFENSLETVPEHFTNAKVDTPVKVLRERIKSLVSEYDDLLEFTRLEDSTKCSVEEDMTQKITMLSMANADLRSSLEYAEKQIQKLLLENEKSKQTINDYDYLVESQNNRYEKRVNELLDQINEWNLNKNVPVQTPQINMFEYEEMIDSIASLKKQNEKLHELIDSANSSNANSKYLEDKNKQLLEENRSLELANSELQSKLLSFQSENVKLNHTINALELQVSQLKIRNQSLLTKYSGLENQNNLLYNNYNTVSSLEKQISELKDQTCTLRSDLMQAKSELNESLDKLLEVTQELDAEERKSSELQKQLQLEKILRKEAEIKLDRIEHSAHGVRRFLSDSVIDQKCKSLDNSVLHMLRKLGIILTKPHSSDTNIDLINMSYESALSNLSETPLENNRALSDTSLSDSTENYFSVDLEKLKSFSSCHLEDSANDEEFINYCKSMFNEYSVQSGDENVIPKTNKSLNEPCKAFEMLIQQLQSEKQPNDNSFLCELDTMLKMNKNLNALNSEKDNQLLELRTELKKNVESKENFKILFEKEQNNYKQARIEVEYCQKLIKQLESEKQQTDDNLQSEIDTMKKIKKDLNALNSERGNQLLELRSELKKNVESRENFKILFEKEQNNHRQARLEVENCQKLIQQLESEKQHIDDNLQSEIDTMKKINKDLNALNSEKDKKLLELYMDLQKNVESKENFKILFEKEQNNYRQARLDVENGQKLIQQLKSENQHIDDNLQSEIDTLKKINEDLNTLNSEKDNKLLELHMEFQKNVESKENFKILLEKEQNNYRQARLDVENCQKLIQQLKSEKQHIDGNLQSEIDNFKKINENMNTLNSEKDNKLLELHMQLQKNVESKENFKILFEKEQNNYRQARLDVENCQKLIQQLKSEKQHVDGNLQSEIDTLKKINEDLNTLTSEKDNKLLELQIELQKKVESQENFNFLFEKEQNNYRKTRLEVENCQKLIQQLESEKQQIADNLQSEIDTIKKINKDLNAVNSEKDNQLLELRMELKKNFENEENFKILFEKEQNNYRKTVLEVETFQKFIQQLESEKQQIADNLQFEIDTIKNINKDLNALNSQKDNQLLELRTELDKNIESKENFKILFEKEQNNYKLARLEVENCQKLIQQLESKKQHIDDNLQSEIDTIKNINEDLNALNSEKDKQLLELHMELQKNVESKENFKILFEKEQNNYRQARIEIENCQKLIEQLKSKKQQIADNLQSEIDTIKKINKDLNALNSEKDNKLLELQMELQKNVESKEHFKILFEKEQNNYRQARLDVENCQKLIQQLKSEKQHINGNLQSEINTIKKMNKDLNTLNSEKDNQLHELHAELKKNVESKEKFRILFEKEQDDSEQHRLEVENCHKLIQQLKSEKRECSNLQSELDSLKKLNKDLNLLNSEKDSQLHELRVELREHVEQIVTLNSKLQEIITEKNKNLKLIEDFQNEQIKLTSEKDALLQRLDILEKNKSDDADTTRNLQKSTIDKMYSEISKLKEILPRDESKSSHIREILLYNRKCWNDNSKLHDVKLIVDKVHLLVEEINLLKHQNNVGYGQLRQVYENMKREVEAERKENNLLITKLENECQKLRDNNDIYRSEVEQLKTSLTVMQAQQLNYKRQLENLSFENQNLVEKVKDIKNLQLNNKKIEQKLQYLLDENKTLTAKLCTTNKCIINYETNEEKLKSSETETGKLRYKVNQSENENGQLIECDAFRAEEDTKEIGPGVLRNSNWNDKLMKRTEFEILKNKYEQLKKRHQSCNQQDSETEATITCRKENKWKQQRKETHDSRRSIDLNTLCLESVVDTCNSCADMNNQLQRTKSDVLKLRKYIDSMSSSEFEKLKSKYETLKKLCRIRNEEISKLKQCLTEKK